MGNHKTIRAAQGCSGRAAKIPVPTAPFTLGRPAAAGQGGGGPGLGPRRRKTEEGTEGGRGWRSPCCPPRRGGGLRSRCPRLGHRMPSRPAHTTQSSPRLKGKKSRSGAVLRYPHTLMALTGVMARGRPPQPPPIQNSGRSLREPC